MPYPKGLHLLKKQSLGHFWLSILSRWSLSPAILMLWSFERFFWGTGCCGHYHYHSGFPYLQPKCIWNIVGIQFFCVFLFVFIGSPLRWAKIWSLDRSPDLWELLSAAESAPKSVGWLWLLLNCAGKLQDHSTKWPKLSFGKKYFWKVRSF